MQTTHAAVHASHLPKRTVKQAFTHESSGTIWNAPRTASEGALPGILSAVPPTGSISLTDRDRRLIGLLAAKVRVLSVGQIAERFWPGSVQPTRLARGRLAKLERAGLLRTASRPSRPLLEVLEPLAIWRPHRPVPDFAAIARQLANRWSDSMVRMECVEVTDEGARGVAGVPAAAPPADSEVTHDLHVAAVYLRMLDELPARASTWILETRLPKGQGVKVPDAMVRDGLERTAIEFGGLYDRAKLEAFHEYCRQERMGYELW